MRVWVCDVCGKQIPSGEGIYKQADNPFDYCIRCYAPSSTWNDSVTFIRIERVA